ncbi:uncharacterized mitochondrial protein AtMg00810-like [Trifolium pratense]|uniref:uncharacterized mitochondrial protein AtMg00810-like n=1 Tax=Trifolium pratense TaxID=57577 RepID=UPI001E695A82|nr:uncharacterized mitochondrial protein AtMg00810-like [Trifolium pratense]
MYRSVVCALQYATITRSMISYAVNKVCQFMSHPSEAHWITVKHIFRYLKGTVDYRMHLFPLSRYQPFPIRAFCDTDWAFDPDDRRSTSGAAIYFGPNLIAWWSRKRPVVARSNTEAEYWSLAHVTAEILWIQTLLAELHVPSATPLTLCELRTTVVRSSSVSSFTFGNNRAR